MWYAVYRGPLIDLLKDCGQLSHKEVKQLALCHTATKCYGQDSSSSNLALEASISAVMLYHLPQRAFMCTHLISASSWPKVRHVQFLTRPSMHSTYKVGTAMAAGFSKNAL